MAKSSYRTVVSVVDGDTVKVARRLGRSRFVRLAGVNAPEKGQRGYGKAKARLKRKVQGKTIALKPVGRSYGRTVAKYTGRKIKL